jgi:hypothetical protein
MERDKRFAQRVAQARAMPIARAERVLHLLIERGDRQATLWYLERVVPEWLTRLQWMLPRWLRRRSVNSNARDSLCYIARTNAVFGK